MANNSNQTDTDISALEKSVQEKTDKLALTQSDLTQTKTSTAPPEKFEWWSVADAMTISSAVLVFGCVIMVLATYLMHKGKNADDVLKLFGTIIIVISAVFLVVAGYTDTQIAPVIGLLGTIAGYLLGRESVENKKDDKDK